MSFLARRLDDPDIVSSFQGASPYPHVVVDGLFDDDLLSDLADRFPRVEDRSWWQYDNPLERKFALNSLDVLDPIFRDFFAEANSTAFVSQLATLSGLPDLIPDGSLLGAGLHQIKPGGKLDVHEDFNVHRELNARRRLNMIVYLNRGWKEEYGGHLQMWDAGMTRCVRSALPTFNRTVVFRTDTGSNHGHPDPLTCPEGTSRISLAMYYYSPLAKDEQVEYVSTRYKRRPGEEWDEEKERLREIRARGRVVDKVT